MPAPVQQASHLLCAWEGRLLTLEAKRTVLGLTTQEVRCRESQDSAAAPPGSIPRKLETG